ncbi:MAG: hypothetical protein JW891_13005 [Candidatus Lokiarchaeota archaeon]|nr:hypothetical protein [Candidatus Lokiarchaeota archaeon]
MDFRFQEIDIQTKSRLCFRCKKPINFKDFCFRNRFISVSRRVELWENTSLEFYCCLCYDEIYRNQTNTLIKNEINGGDAEVMKFLESKLNLELPIVRKINFNTVGVVIEKKRITGLGLYKIGLNEIPEYLSELDHLAVLNLAWNNISEIPEYFGSLKMLRSIDLIGNKIEQLPLSIVNLIALEDIDLSFNLLGEIPPFVCKIPSLKLLKLFKNKISFIPSSIINKESKGLKILL